MTSPELAFIDSHIHLWPSSSCNAESHAWMSSAPALARQFSIEDYENALKESSQSQVNASQLKSSLTTTGASKLTIPARLRGFVFVETDPAPGPSHLPPEKRWKAALEELRFLRRLVEGAPFPGEGHSCEHSNMCLGIIMWAPMNDDLETLKLFLRVAESEAGDMVWSRVKGVRWLLQSMTDEAAFRAVVEREAFARCVKELWSRGWVFEVGIDCRSGGIWQMECITAVIKSLKAREGNGIFVLDHMCKPDFSAINSQAFQRWTICIAQLSATPNVFMKISGAFSELQPSLDVSNLPAIKDIGQKLQPWFETIMMTFGPSKSMFGSDWPVCTLGDSTQKAWGAWTSIVQWLMANQELDVRDQQRIWAETASRAFSLVAV